MIGVLLGSLVGFFEPQLAVMLKPLGDVFIKAIKVIVTPIPHIHGVHGRA